METHKENPPDLILCDVMMPKMNGIELYKEISKDPKLKKIPFIFISAQAMETDLISGLSLGAEDYIVKPFRNKTLLGKINSILSATHVQPNFIECAEDVRQLEINENRSQERTEVFLFIVEWDDMEGAKVTSSFPKDADNIDKLETVARQVYKASSAIYGNESITESQEILLHPENCPYQAYAYFDSFKDTTKRSGRTEFMIAVLAPSITYMQSIRIKNKIAGLSSLIKSNDCFDIEQEWKQIFNSMEIIPTVG